MGGRVSKTLIQDLQEPGSRHFTTRSPYFLGLLLLISSFKFDLRFISSLTTNQAILELLFHCDTGKHIALLLC